MGYNAVAIRRATPEDVEQIGALTAAAYAQWVPVMGREPVPMATNYVDAIAKHIVAVLENDDVMCGVLELVSEKDHVLIDNIAVHPDQQRRGFGRTLMNHAESTARALGHSEVRLYTNALFTSKLQFYDALGYSVLETSVMIPGSITVHLHKML